jgi:Protein of unknown function (DUF2795)
MPTDPIESKHRSKSMDSSGDLSDLNLSELQQYLGRTNFPAEKEEVASNAESNGAPQAVVARIRNSSIERFEGLEQLLQAVRGD